MTRHATSGARRRACRVHARRPQDKLERSPSDALDGVGSRVLAFTASIIHRSLATPRLCSVPVPSDDCAGRLPALQPARRRVCTASAAAVTGEAVRRSPDDPQRLFDHAQNVFWVGEVARHRGQNNAAKRPFASISGVATGCGDRPRQSRWRMEYCTRRRISNRSSQSAPVRRSGAAIRSALRRGETFSRSMKTMRSTKRSSRTPGVGSRCRARCRPR